MSDQDLFAAATPVIDPNKDYFSDLVGEGKKYVDPKAAGRAIVEKDMFISKLEQETAVLRSELQARMKMEDFVDKMQSLQAVPPPVQSQVAPTEGDGKSTALKPEDVDARIEERIAQRDKANQRTRNLMEVKSALTERFGDAFSSVVEDRARQLGLGKEFLNQLAAEHPKAFFATMGLDQKPASAAPGVPPRTQMTSEAFRPASDEKTQSYYDQLLKSDRSKYLSREVQLEMHKQAMKLGEAFFK